MRGFAQSSIGTKLQVNCYTNKQLRSFVICICEVASSLATPRLDGEMSGLPSVDMQCLYRNGFLQRGV